MDFGILVAGVLVLGAIGVVIASDKRKKEPIPIKKKEDEDEDEEKLAS